MKLYSYDHCPYCVKARMIFGIKGVPFAHKILLNDDEETPISMVGKKMVPILEKEDGTYMPESMEIIYYIDGLKTFGSPRVKASKKNSDLADWLAQSRQYSYALAMPRWVKIGLEEFSTSSAVQYFTHKKFSSIGDFDDNLAISRDLVFMAEHHLSELELLLSDGPWFWGEDVNEDDFHVFATLRVLTVVKGLRFPKKLDLYSKRVSEVSEVPLHWDKALGVDI